VAIDGVMVLNTDIFTHEPALIKAEYYLNTMVGLFVGDHIVYAVNSENFIGDLTAPHDLVRIGNILKARNFYYRNGA
jgi:hypothetical protein